MVDLALGWRVLGEQVQPGSGAAAVGHGGGGGGRTKADPGTPAGEDTLTQRTQPSSQAAGAQGLTLQMLPAPARQAGPRGQLLSGSLPGMAGPQGSLPWFHLSRLTGSGVGRGPVLGDLHSATAWLGCSRPRLEGLEVQEENSAIGPVIATCGSSQGFCSLRDTLLQTHVLKVSSRTNEAWERVKPCWSASGHFKPKARAGP